MPHLQQANTREPLNVSDRPVLTAAEHDQLARRLEELRRVRDEDLSLLLRETRSLVASDAEEESLQIQEDFVVVDARIAHLDQLLHEARIVNSSQLAKHIVALGRTVTVRCVGTGDVTSCRLAGSGAPTDHSVSARSPIGKALLGRSIGETVIATLPNGRLKELEILKVEIVDDPQSCG